MNSGLCAARLHDLTLILAAHGSPVDPTVNRAIFQLAQRLACCYPFANVIPAFHYGEPGFAAAAQQVTSNRAVVVPMMTSEGYFTKVVLRKAFTAAARALSQTTFVIADPIGTHSDVPSIVRSRLQRVLERLHWSEASTPLLLVGHGTRKHSNSRVATVQLAAAIDALRGTAYPKLHVAFVDDDPGIREAIQCIHTKQLVVIPFLISNGPHVKVDLPSALGLNPMGESTGPRHRKRNAMEIVVDLPFGSLKGLHRLIVDRSFEVCSKMSNIGEWSATSCGEVVNA